MRQYKRADRLSGQILRDISELFHTDMPVPGNGMLTFTRVTLTDDLRYAKVYYSYLGSEEDRALVARYLEQEKNHVRSRIGRNLRVRHIPELTFVFDKSIEDSIRIEQLLNEIKRERKDDEQD
ncbi:30S ribosome-binding factor RbfA [candidate division GN15 bacterium]|nr:30S ribosome-binding factor RbfA [candidate division GN15 bacterium]